MRRSSRISYLRSVPMFSACTAKELQAVARLIEVVDVEEGQLLVNQGERGHEFYVIGEGKADVVRDGSTVASLGPGDYFGELAVLDPQPRNATVAMTSPGQVLILSEREFFGLLHDAPSLARTLLIGMARRLHSDDSVGR